MPWDAADATRHTKKAQSAVSKRQWSDVANSVLKRGGSEGSAVRQANAVVARRGSSHMARKSKMRGKSAGGGKAPIESPMSEGRETMKGRGKMRGKGRSKGR